MPNARTHDGITVVTGIALAPVTYVALVAQGQPATVSGVDSLVLVGAHLFSGIMFSPDLDIDSAIDNRWGIFYWLWRPYMWLTPHRRWFSHGLVLPPLLRLLYLATVLTLLFLSIAWLLAQISIVVPNYHLYVADYLVTLVYAHPRRTWLFAFGFITGGAAHSIADWLATGGKRFLRRVGLRVPRNNAGDRY
jgi:uncharacterized metal-binding protein